MRILCFFIIASLLVFMGAQPLTAQECGNDLSKPAQTPGITSVGQSFIACSPTPSVFKKIGLERSGKVINARTGTLKIFKGETKTGTPQYTQAVSLPGPDVLGKPKMVVFNLDSGTGSLECLPNEKYTFFIEMDGQIKPSSNYSNPYPNGRAFAQFETNPSWDFVFYVETVDQDPLEIFYNTYGGQSKFVTHYQDAITAYLNAENKVKADDYAGAKIILDALWAKYPVASSSWNASENTKEANGSWNGNPVAYSGLRMLTTIVEHNLNKPYPNYQPHHLHMKVVLVGQTTGTMPLSPSDFGKGTGESDHKVTLDPRVKENNYQRLRDNLAIFIRYVNAITDGRQVVDVEFIDQPSFIFTAAIMADRNTMLNGLSRGAMNALINGLPQEVKDDADMWWVVYPSFAPGTGPNNKSYTNYPGQTFVTGGMDKDDMGRAIFLCDDLFFLDRQPAFPTRTLTEVERRCYPPEWFQHEFFHYLCKLFPSFQFDSPTHIWQTMTPPAGFTVKDGNETNRIMMDEADFIQNAIDLLFKTAAKRPLHERLEKRKPGMPAAILNSLTSDKFLGSYENVETTIINGYEKGNIINNNEYQWETNNGQRIRPLIMTQIADGYLDVRNYQNDFLILLKVDENTGEYLPDVYGFKDGPAVFVKKQP